MKSTLAIAEPPLADELRAALPLLRALTARIETVLKEGPAEVAEPPMTSREIAERAHVSQQCARNWIRRYRWGPCVNGRYAADRRLAESFLNERLPR